MKTKNYRVSLSKKTKAQLLAEIKELRKAIDYLMLTREIK